MFNKGITAQTHRNIAATKDAIPQKMFTFMLLAVYTFLIIANNPIHIANPMQIETATEPKEKTAESNDERWHPTSR